MNSYTFFWLDGEVEILLGEDELDAVKKSSRYFSRVFSVLELAFYAEGDAHNDYVWNRDLNAWKRLPNQ